MKMLDQIVKKLVQLSDSFEETLGSLDDFLEKLLGPSGKLWLYEFKKFLRREKTWVNPIINCDAQPAKLKDLEVVKHIKAGQLEWDPSKVSEYLAERQQNGVITGNDLRKELEGKSVLNACVLDYLFTHPEFIPDEWKDGKARFFWGTVYKRAGGSRVVRGLFWGGDRWGWDYFWLDNVFYSSNPALLAA